ncbi:MAG TPA: SAM-dependent methyltransferase [Mycobacteriales bacterium]|nr:SAM-dependent methyltransferase [Mycobacteriales bacterium]
MTNPGWSPAGVDPDRATAARVYDALLGGTHNFAVDRDVARALEAINPHVRELARANRAFLGRAVRFLIDTGIRQFVDIGSGIPTAGNVHEVAQRLAPDARVVYVDNDPVAIGHGKAILAGNDQAAAIQADLRQPEEILRHPDLRGLLDLTQPVAILLVAILHFVPDDDDPAGIVARLRDTVAPGSYLTLCHGTNDDRPVQSAAMTKLYDRVSASAWPRHRAEILRLFDGFELIEPGLVYIPQWRPDSPDDLPEHPENYMALVGVGRKL